MHNSQVTFMYKTMVVAPTRLITKVKAEITLSYFSYYYYYTTTIDRKFKLR